MVGIDEREMAIAVENAEKHGGITAHLMVLAEIAIDVVENLRAQGSIACRPVWE